MTADDMTRLRCSCGHDVKFHHASDHDCNTHVLCKKCEEEDDEPLTINVTLRAPIQRMELTCVVGVADEKD